MSLEFSAEATKKIQALCERYPTKKPVVMAALHLAQKEHGHLGDDALALVARTLDLSLAHVYGVATFYGSGTDAVRGTPVQSRPVVWRATDSWRHAPATSSASFIGDQW
jgi:NADH:ubiquinone oxidoreductase subunit E